MKKRLTSAVLVLAMVLTLFSGLTLTASAATVYEQFVKATSLEEITSGNEFIILAQGKDSTYYIFKMSSTAFPMANGTADYSSIPSEITSVDDTAILKCQDGVSGYYKISNSRTTTIYYLNPNGLTVSVPSKDTTQVTLTYNSDSSSFSIGQKGGNTLGIRSSGNNKNKWGFAGSSNQYGAGKVYLYVKQSCTHSNLDYIDAADPSCEATGTVAHYHCNDCGKNYSDDTCETTIDDVSIPALGHSWDAGTVTTPPTCTAEGVMSFSCTREGCGATKTESVAASGHADNDADGFCDNCGTPNSTSFSVTYSLTTTLNSWDNVVIYSPTASGALTSSLNYNNYIECEDVSPESGSITVSDSSAIEAFTVEPSGTSGQFYLRTAEGKYLTAGNSISFADSKTDKAIWELSPVSESSNVYIHSVNYAYKDEYNQYLEYYSSKGGVTVYGMNSPNSIYEFQLYSIGANQCNGVKVALGAKDASSDIALNVYFTIPAGSSATRVFVDGTYYNSVASLEDTTDGKKVSIPVAAKDYESVHTVELKDSQNNAVSVVKNGAEATVVSCSISDYISYIESYDEDDAYDDAKPVVEALEDYCRLAQAALGDTPETVPTSLNNDADLAAIHPDTDWTGWTDDYEKPTNEITLADGTTKIKYYGATLVLEDKVTVRFYFTVTNGVADDIVAANTCDFTCFDQNRDERDVSIKAIAKGNMIALNVTGIRAVDLDDLFTVGLTANSTTITVPSYGPFTYGARMFGKESTSASMKKLIQALKLYNEAAEAYFTPAP